MSVGLYMDEHVDSAITQGLDDCGVDVLTVQADGRSGTSDPAVLDRAGDLGRVVFTSDRDFLAEATRRQRSGKSFAGVIYFHRLDVDVGRCITDLQMIAGASDPIDHAEVVTFLPL